MPAYNFLSRFAELVEFGRKCQTIRPKRKRPTKPGDILYLYTGMRTKQCRKLKETICVGVWPIEIHPTYIKIGEQVLGVPEMWDFAKLDGFDTLADFYEFFKGRYGVPHDVELELIRW